MRLALFLATLLGAVPLAASTAVADAGVSISWGDYCWSDAGATRDLSWACDSDGYDGIRMTCSFKWHETRDDFAGVGVYLTGYSESGGWPDWWQLADGGCRPEAVPQVHADASGIAGGASACADPWAGGEEGGGVGYYLWDGRYSQGWVSAVWAQTERTRVEAGVEYFAFQLRFPATRTTDGACPGCDTPIIWGLTKMDVWFFDQTCATWLDSAYPGGSQCLVWQGATYPCAWPLPVRNITWGQIKNLYR